MGPGAWEEKADGLPFLPVRGLGSPADGLGHCVPPSGWRKPTPPLPFLPIRIGVPHGTEGGPSHAGAGYLHYGRTAVKGPGRGRKSCPEDGLRSYSSERVCSFPFRSGEPVPLGSSHRPGGRGLLPGSATDADPAAGFFKA